MRSEGGRQQQSEGRNLLFEQGEECPARGGIRAEEEDRASAGPARKNNVGLNWLRYAGRAGGGARPDGSRWRSAEERCQSCGEETAA